MSEPLSFVNLNRYRMYRRTDGIVSLRWRFPSLEAPVTALPIPLGSIERTTTNPTVGRVVLVKFEDGGAVGTLPGTVIRAFNPPTQHPFVTVDVVGDGPVNCPLSGHRLLFSLTLFEPLPSGAVPDVAMQHSDDLSNPFRGRRVWAEWMPYQAARHKEQKAATGESGSTA